MTDLAAALADTRHLADFEGVQVLRTQVAITNAGDGLSNAMAVEPLALEIGATVHVVLECRVQQVRYVPTNKDDPTEGLARVHVLRAGRATLVDRAGVELALTEQDDRIRQAAEQAKGITRLPGMGTEVPDYDLDADGDPDGDDDGEPPPADMGTARKRRRSR